MTKARLALLRAVARYLVWESVVSRQAYVARDGWHRKVTYQIDALRRARWVRIGDNYSGEFRQLWQLTDAGRAVLDSHGGAK